MIALILYILASIAVLALIAILTNFLHPAFGQKPKNELLERVKKSKNYGKKRFKNTSSLKINTSDHAFPIGVFRDYFFKNFFKRRPRKKLQTIELNKEEYKNDYLKAGLVSWLGHSSILIKLEKTTIIIDPIFSNRASPFSFLGPKKFDYTNDTSVEKLPKIDAVLISHDHYDHLDYKTIRKLNKTSVKKFFVPLGVESHLIKWGVKKEKIISLDWNESSVFQDLTLTATPARHFSGRGLGDGGKTLWASWVIKSSDKKLYFSGDTGYFEGFKKIGEAHGPFDLAFMECGAYSKYWKQVHMHPKLSIKAALDLKAKIVLPIHNSKFNLALHAWDEPRKLIEAEAAKNKIPLVKTKIGESFNLKNV